jgi:hypothetical protein
MAFNITEDQRTALRDDGIVKLPGLIDSSLLDDLRACFEWSIAHPGPIVQSFDLGGAGEPEGENFLFVDNANPAARPMYEKLVANAPFGQVAAELWGSEYVGYLAEEIFWKKGKSLQTFWHQDTVYLPWRGEHWCNFWIPLCEMTAEAAIRMVRGSHRGIMYDGTTFNPADPTEPLWGDAGNFPRLPDISAEAEADPSSWDIAGVDVEPGDVVVIHPHCLHSGGATDETLPERRNLVLRFFGDESYYSGHLPDAPGMYENAPIPAAGDGHLKDGDLYRPANALQANLSV